MNSAKIYLSTTEKVSKIDLNARCVPLEAHYRSEARFHEEESSTLAEDSAEWWRVGPATKRRKNRGKRSISQSLARENASTGQSCALERVRERSASGRFTCALLPNGDALATCTVFLHTCGWTNSQDVPRLEDSGRKKIFQKRIEKKRFFF